MNSALIRGEVVHCRIEPAVHRFQYPITACLFDLDELPALSARVSGFGYNRPSLVSLYDRDYLPSYSGPLRERVARVLHDHGLERPARVELLTVPRLLLPVFNPVSFYLCYDDEGELYAFLAEVNNTFSETHLYLLTERHARPAAARSYQCSKEFHVSPFNAIEGEYRFYLVREADHVSVRVHIVRDERPVFTAELSGGLLPLRSGGRDGEGNTSLYRHLPRFFWAAHAAFPRILWQAAQLYFRKGLRVYTKPIASSAMTIRKADPGVLQALCRSILRRYLRGFRRGRLTLLYADGTSETFGETSAPHHAAIRVLNHNFFVRSVLGGHVGFGEAYVEGFWDTDDLTALLRLFVEHYEAGEDTPPLLSSLAIVRDFLRFRLLPNSKRRSKANVRAHYDLSNELFQLFLDRSMTYSCARFSHEEEALEEAQRNKLRSMIEKARITSDDHVLEIGSGWGSFAIEAVKQTGCRVTTVTLSEAQHQLAMERVRAAGLEDKISVKICDYRELEGTFDKIVSIEMLEAVGHEHLGQFFNICDRLLKEDGLVALQVITVPDQRYEAYRRGCDFIQKHVFPGGLCPSLSALTTAISKSSRFIVEDLENIGVHYARTIAEWRERFKANMQQLPALGFDQRFTRIWSYYFAYCEAGFATRTLGTLQLVLTRPNNRQLPGPPLPGSGWHLRQEGGR